MSRPGWWITGALLMTVPVNVAIPGTGLCWYGIQRLPGLLEAFTKEITGVKEAQDIEYIHRMRVASRRLRAALPLFSSCFPEKQYARWMQELIKITRALGDARDADVQIAFLQKTIKKMQKGQFQEKNDIAPDKLSMEPAARFLLLSLQKKRGILQKRVLTSLRALDKSRVTEEMQLAFATLNNGFVITRARPKLSGIPPLAALRIGKRLYTLLSYDHWVLQPEAVAEHHATRIAAKKLRYTMEIYGPVYRNSLKKPLTRVKKIQEILGDIHDCDMWIDHITLILLRERTLLRSYKGTKRPDTATLASLKMLLQDRENERKRLYRQFVHYWRALSRAKLWDELRRTLDSGRKARYRPRSPSPDRDATDAVNILAQEYPDGQQHSRHVTMLALSLFDGLQSLHNLGPRDRSLLEYAGLLHDIGWKYGQEGHNRRGAEMVFSDENLPFDLPERGMIGLTILSHRGRERIVSHPLFSIMSPVFQKKTRMLAAILRLADGLDYLHTGSVREVRCMVTPDGVICDVAGTGDISAETGRARDKADLFLQVFEQPLVIR
jgi:CHAD domain-containing protein